MTRTYVIVDEKNKQFEKHFCEIGELYIIKYYE